MNPKKNQSNTETSFKLELIIKKSLLLYHRMAKKLMIWLMARNGQRLQTIHVKLLPSMCCFQMLFTYLYYLTLHTKLRLQYHCLTFILSLLYSGSSNVVSKLIYMRMALNTSHTYVNAPLTYLIQSVSLQVAIISYHQKNNLFATIYIRIFLYKS